MERGGDASGPDAHHALEGVLLAHDPPGDQVAGRGRRPGLSGRGHLASLTRAPTAGRALDVGTGCGIQALPAAEHADRVVATDVNPRALELPRSARHSAASITSRREGSWFDPVAGEEFDLVVCNPPYVISPENDLVYRDASLGRDGCRAWR